MNTEDFVNAVIYCKECPNCYYLESTGGYYCEKYSIEIEDIAREFCEIELD